MILVTSKEHQEVYIESLVHIANLPIISNWLPLEILSLHLFQIAMSPHYIFTLHHKKFVCDKNCLKRVNYMRIYYTRLFFVHKNQEMLNQGPCQNWMVEGLNEVAFARVWLRVWRGVWPIGGCNFFISRCRVDCCRVLRPMVVIEWPRTESKLLEYRKTPDISSNHNPQTPSFISI